MSLSIGSYEDISVFKSVLNDDAFKVIDALVRNLLPDEDGYIELKSMTLDEIQKVTGFADDLEKGWYPNNLVKIANIVKSLDKMGFVQFIPVKCAEDILRMKPGKLINSKKANAAVLPIIPYISQLHDFLMLEKYGKVEFVIHVNKECMMEEEAIQCISAANAGKGYVPTEEMIEKRFNTRDIMNHLKKFYDYYNINFDEKVFDIVSRYEIRFKDSECGYTAYNCRRALSVYGAYLSFYDRCMMALMIADKPAE